MPNSISDLASAEWNSLLPGNSIIQKEEAWWTSITVGPDPTESFTDAKKRYLSANLTPLASISDVERAWWYNLSVTPYALGLPPTLSLTDYKYAVLLAGGPS